jgi:hypothetical protein
LPLFCHGKPFLRTNMQLLRGNTHLLRGNTAASPWKRVAFMWNTIWRPERGTVPLLRRNMQLLRGIFFGFIRREEEEKIKSQRNLVARGLKGTL